MFRWNSVFGMIFPATLKLHSWSRTHPSIRRYSRCQYWPAMAANTICTACRHLPFMAHLFFYRDKGCLVFFIRSFSLPVHGSSAGLRSSLERTESKYSTGRTRNVSAFYVPGYFRFAVSIFNETPLEYLNYTFRGSLRFQRNYRMTTYYSKNYLLHQN